MMRNVFLLIIAMSIFTIANQSLTAQEAVLMTPAEAKKFQEVSKYSQMVDFINKLAANTDILKVEVIGKSAKGYDINVLKFSNSVFGKDKNKIRVLMFAQQHGNEQSGKEGALMLAGELAKPENSRIFDHIDLALVPQVNPDGSEQNSRRNGNGIDLNRNHLIMTEPEVIALHNLFDKFMFEVTMDVHEYYPYSEEWKKLGYRTNTDILMGFNTHPNIPTSIRDYQFKKCRPYFSALLSSKGISNAMYCPGGPPEIDYIRYSTFDINDGRQSFGIQNTFSFIQEGMNGEDAFVENLAHRSYSQFQGMLTLLKYVSENYAQMKSIVTKEREPKNYNVKNIALQMEHISDGSKLPISVYSYKTKRDSLIMVNDFRPVVKPTLSISRPYGYLIPKSDNELVDWVSSHGFVTESLHLNEKFIYEQLIISSIDSIDFERDTIAVPKIQINRIKNRSVNINDYLFVPTGQLKGNTLIIGIEPQSELGLHTYSQFKHMIHLLRPYPVIRVRQLIEKN